MVASALALLVGCGGGEEDEREVYRELEGIYELQRVERYDGVCGPSGDAAEVRGPARVVAFVVEEGVPDVQLHASGCESVEECRGIAAEARENGGSLGGSGFPFRHLVYSRVNDDGRIDGVKLMLLAGAEECSLNLLQFSLRETEAGVDFGVTTREGTRYPHTDGACPTRPDLEAHWKSWQTTRCLDHEVLTTDFAEPL